MKIWLTPVKPYCAWEDLVFTPCDPAVAIGMERMCKDLTKALTDDHGKPKQVSPNALQGKLKSLASTFLDQQVSTAIADFSGPWDRTLLSGFAVSGIWSTRPTRRHDRAFARATTEEEEAVLNADAWRAELQKAIRSAYQVGEKRGKDRARKAFALEDFFWQPDSRAPSECDESCVALNQFTATLDSLIALTDYSLSLLRTPQPRYCELCWRHTQAYRNSTSGIPISGARISQRFCDSHDPRNPKSDYRRAMRYKARFTREIEALCGYPGASSASPAELLRPETGHSEDVRRVAYALVHMRLTEAGRQIWQLHMQDLANAEISRRLGITRQAVSKSLRSLKHKLRIAKRIQWPAFPFH